MASLTLDINNVRGIKKLEFTFPLDPGVYAITGPNGIGKSTVLMLMAQIFRFVPFDALLRPFSYTNNSSLSFKIGNNIEKWIVEDGKWIRKEKEGVMNVRGFYEGSLMSGTRFWNTTPEIIQKLKVPYPFYLRTADFLISRPMGSILFDDEEHYMNLFRVDKKRAKDLYEFDGVPYYLKIDEQTYLSEFEFSTGEFLVLNLLHMLVNLVRRHPLKSMLILIDEVEIALHPSAILRLLSFAHKFAAEHNVIFLFATHSLEIIHNLNPTRLYYLQYEKKGELICKSPNYPAYVTRNIYQIEGFDLLILVEDALAVRLVNKSLRDNKIDEGRRVHVLPVGGFTNTLEMHNAILHAKLLRKSARVLSIIDGDVKDRTQATIRNKKQQKEWLLLNEADVLYLPIKSLEKHMKERLVREKDEAFARKIRDRLFHEERSEMWFEVPYRGIVRAAIDEDIRNGKEVKNENHYFSDGKKLYEVFENRANRNGISKEDFNEGMCNLMFSEGTFEDFGVELLAKVNQIFSN